MVSAKPRLRQASEPRRVCRRLFGLSRLARAADIQVQSEDAADLGLCGSARPRGPRADRRRRRSCRGAAVGRRHRKIRARLAQDLIHLPTFAGLAFQRPNPRRRVRRKAHPLASVDLGALDPFAQGLRRAADLRRRRYDRRPARRSRVIAIEDHTHRAAADLLRERVSRIAREGATFSGTGASGTPGTVWLFVAGGVRLISFLPTRATSSQGVPRSGDGTCCKPGRDGPEGPGDGPFWPRFWPKRTTGRLFPENLRKSGVLQSGVLQSGVLRRRWRARRDSNP